MQHIVIIGATSAIATHCARLWVKSAPVCLTLVGRDETRTNHVADDLRVRSPQSVVRVITADFLSASATQEVVDSIVAFAAVDVVLIAHGMLSDQTLCEADLMACEAVLQINGLSPALFAEAFAKPMVAANHGVIAIVGSVAGDRGRKTNYVYGAAKGLLARYAQGMQHRLAYKNVKIVLVKPGPTDTPMTSHFKAQGQKLASVEVVAQDIVEGIAAGKLVVYTPGRWHFIMMVVMHLPRVIFNKLSI